MRFGATLDPLTSFSAALESTRDLDRNLHYIYASFVSRQLVSLSLAAA
jgi:hypothetical protein